jgi:hypothetical protein
MRATFIGGSENLKLLCSSVEWMSEVLHHKASTEIRRGDWSELSPRPRQSELFSATPNTVTQDLHQVALLAVGFGQNSFIINKASLAQTACFSLTRIHPKKSSLQFAV